MPYFLTEIPSSAASPDQPAPPSDLPRNLHPATAPDAAALAPAAPLDGLPDPWTTTIPSYVPTPPGQAQVLQPSSAEIGGPDVPQPGASLDSHVPPRIDRYDAGSRHRNTLVPPRGNRSVRCDRERPRCTLAPQRRFGFRHPAGARCTGSRHRRALCPPSRGYRSVRRDRERPHRTAASQ